MFSKKQIFLQIFTVLALIGVISGSYLLVAKSSTVAEVTNVELEPEHYEQKPEQKVNSVATVSSNPRIEEKILGSKAVINTILITDKGDNLLVLVNKKIKLPTTYAPGDLVSIGGFITAPVGSSLRREAAQALNDLKSQASAAGANLSIVSAFRSYSQQVATFNGWVASAGLKNAEKFSARPGHSQHQLGTAVDFGAEGRTDFSESFGTTKEGVWLAQNAYKYGYVLSYPKGKESVTGYSYEPWHYRYIGVENAQKMVSSGKILEEYLQIFGTW